MKLLGRQPTGARRMRVESRATAPDGGGFGARGGRGGQQVRGPFSVRRREGAWKEALLRRMLAGADFLAVLAATAIAGLVNPTGIATTVWAAGLVPLWIVSAKLHGLYDNDHVRIKHLTTDELPTLFRWATVSVVITAFLVSLGPSPLSPAAVFTMWLVVLGAAFGLRVLARATWRWIVPPERGLVIGEGHLADSVARKLALEPGHHLELVASMSLQPRSRRIDDVDTDSPNTGELVRETIVGEDVDRVVLAVHDLDEDTLASVVSTCRTLGVKLSVAPPLRAMLGTAVRLNHLAELPLIEFRTWDPSRSTVFLKRAADSTLAAVGLVILAPFLALIAVLVKLDSPGPALFRQTRAGLAGAPFQLIKFRTMVQDAEARLEELVRVGELPEPMFKLRGDPRITRIGRFLRRTSIDELPQLINVVKGEMSLVGPRPEELRLVERYDDDLRFRLEMRPGITGPMQVHGRGELTFQERVAVEREYIENYSLRKDLKLLLQTVAAVVRRRGAF